VLPVFVRHLGQELHAEANAEEWLASLDGIALERLDQRTLPQALHRLAERTDTGQHDPLRGVELRGG
jgi:hypothetical protein